MIEMTRRPNVCLIAVLSLSSLLFLNACSQQRTVERVDPGLVLDYQSGFDEDDAREVAAATVSDALQRPWIERWEAGHGRAPTVIVGDLANQTSDYIDSKLFTKTFERELLNSGRVSIVASAAERVQLRSERRNAQDWSRPETIKRMAYELGADLMLIGWIGEDREVSRDRSRTVHYYQVSLELVDVESNEKVWIGTHEIEKRTRE
jgi:uncharacterized protein (TIGR02722 family)